MVWFTKGLNYCFSQDLKSWELKVIFLSATSLTGDCAFVHSPSMAMGCPLEGSLTAARGEDSTEGHLLQCVPTIQLCRDALRAPLRSEN